jgi:hypothetical protein
MPIKLSSKGGADFDPIPSGVHQAVCYGVVDIGTQKSANSQFGPKRKLVIIWELPHERADFGEDKKNQPRAISQTFTQSLGTKANLRGFLESWRGKSFTDLELEGFDPKVLIGVNCQLNIIHVKKGDKTYANIKTIMPLLKGQPSIKNENKGLYFSLDGMDLKNIQYPDNMPNWLKEKIAFCEEAVGAHYDSGSQPDAQEETQPLPPHAAKPEDLDEDAPF